MEQFSTVQPISTKKQFKKTINWVSLVLVLQLLLSYVLVFAYNLTGFGFALEVAVIRVFPAIAPYLDTEFFSYLLQIVISTITMVAIPYLFVRWQKLSIPPLVSKQVFTADGPKQIQKGFCLALGGNALFALLSTILIGLLEQRGIETPPLNLTMPQNNPLSAVLFFIMVCMIAPLTEEYLFRGVILRALKPYGNMVAIIFSSLAFSLIHGNLHQIPATFAGGLIIGYCAVQFDSLAIPVAIHFLNNTLSTLLDLVPEEGVSKILSAVNLLFCGCIVYFVICIIRFLSKKELRAPLTNSPLSFSHRWSQLITSLPFVLFLALCTAQFLLPYYTEQVAAFLFQ